MKKSVSLLLAGLMDRQISAILLPVDAEAQGGDRGAVAADGQGADGGMNDTGVHGGSSFFRYSDGSSWGAAASMVCSTMLSISSRSGMEPGT